MGEGEPNVNITIAIVGPDNPNCHINMQATKAGAITLGIGEEVFPPAKNLPPVYATTTQVYISPPEMSFLAF